MVVRLKQNQIFFYFTMEKIDPVEVYIFSPQYSFIVARRHADDDPFSIVTVDLADDFHENLYGTCDTFFFTN